MNSIDSTITCTKCGGSIHLGASTCIYCGTKHDRDSAVLKYGLEQSKSGRKCPDCKIELESVDLEIGHKFIVERCHDCYGIFLDKLELQELLKLIYSYPGKPNTARLKELLYWPDREREKVRYKKCPECDSIMSRKNFGFRSGIIMDICRDHGTWLDGGELYQLMKWSSAGGQNTTCPFQKRKDQLKKRHEKRTADLKREKNARTNGNIFRHF